MMTNEGSTENHELHTARFSAVMMKMMSDECVECSKIRTACKCRIYKYDTVYIAGLFPELTSKVIIFILTVSKISCLKY